MKANTRTGGMTDDECRAEIERLRKLADDLAPPYGLSVRASIAAECYRDAADALEAKLAEVPE